jgi:hypothetical protein
MGYEWKKVKIISSGFSVLIVANLRLLLPDHWTIKCRIFISNLCLRTQNLNVILIQYISTRCL